MTIQDFMLEGKKAVLSGLRACGEKDVIVKETETVKANDTRMYGLDLRREGSLCGSLIYIDDLFERYMTGEDLDMLMHEVADRCISGLFFEVPNQIAVDDLDFDSVRRRLTVRLMSVQRNMTYMKDKPYIDVGGGLALIASINCDESITSEWRITVTDGLLKEIGCDKETLLTAALANTMALEPPVLLKLSDALLYKVNGEADPVNYLRGYSFRNMREENHCAQKSCEPAECEEIFILTNKSMYQGSAVLFYPEVLKNIAEFLECGFSVIPSSVHEVLIVPDCMGIDPHHLRSFLLTANDHFVESEDILADRIYHYDPETDELKYPGSGYDD